MKEKNYEIFDYYIKREIIFISPYFIYDTFYFSLFNIQYLIFFY